MGQLSDPFQQGEDDQEGISISGLPGDLVEPDTPDGPVDAATMRAMGVSVERGPTDAAGDEPEDEGMSGESIAYDLDDWSDLERQAITERLREAGVPHGWEEARLLIAVVDEGVVENILDIVEGESDDGTEPLDPARDQVAYDVSELDDEALDALADAVDEAGIAVAWGDEELYVYADDEQAVDAMFDAVQHPDEIDAEDDEPTVGAASAELLGDVFVAADRLQHDGDDNDGMASLLGVAVTIDDLDPPYGMGSRDWERVCAAVGEVADLLAADTLDQEKVMASARDLRATLRPFV